MFTPIVVKMFPVFIARSFLKYVRSFKRKSARGFTLIELLVVLAIIGSINWGLIGIFQFDLVAWLFGGQGAILSRIIYSLVGLAGLWCITLLYRRVRACVEGE